MLDKERLCQAGLVRYCTAAVSAVHLLNNISHLNIHLTATFVTMPTTQNTDAVTGLFVHVILYNVHVSVVK